MSQFIKTLLATALVSTVFCANSYAQSIVFKAKKAITNSTTGTIEQPVLLVKDGRIHQLSTANTEYKADKIIVGDNLWITPGIFAPFSSLGLVEVSGESSTNNTRANQTDSTVNIRAADSFNPKSTSVPISRVGGVTYAAIAPQASVDIFGGIGMIASTAGDFNSVLNDSAFIYVSYTSGSKRAGGSKGAAMAYLRGALSDAKNYSARFKTPVDGDALRRADAKALRPALSGALPLLISADRAVDIHNIIKLKSSYPKLNIIIVGAAEGWMVAGALAKSGISVMVDPIEALPYSFDTLGSRGDNFKLLIDAGVNTAIISRSATGGGAHNLRLLPQHAGNAVANGATWADSFKAITSTPARMFGLPELGRIKVGDRANFVVWNGDPLEVTSAPIAVFIDGKLQSLTSRQTELANRYNPTRENKPPYGYRP